MFNASHVATIPSHVLGELSDWDIVGTRANPVTGGFKISFKALSILTAGGLVDISKKKGGRVNLYDEVCHKRNEQNHLYHIL